MRNMLEVVIGRFGRGRPRPAPRGRPLSAPLDDGHRTGQLPGRDVPVDHARDALQPFRRQP
jgi:hypothetical protein